MTDPNRDGKGFGGLSGLSGRHNSSAPDNQTKTESPANIPSPAVEFEARQEQTQTATPRWRGIAIASVFGLSALWIVAAVVQQPSGVPMDSAAEAAAAATEAQAAADAAASVSDQTASDAAQASADAAAAAAAAAADAASTYADAVPITSGEGEYGLEDEQRPGVGVDQVLYAPQIRYCVREKIRLDAADHMVDTSDGSSVDRFNSMIEDFNSRCGSFKYRAGTLEPIQREADSMRSQLEAQGRTRFSSTDRSVEPIAYQSSTPKPNLRNDGADTAVSNRSDPEYARNLNTCLSGSYPMLCKHEVLTPEEAEQVKQAELAKNFETCVSGRYPSLCNHELLTSGQGAEVQEAELSRNLETCISGQYPMLCEHEKLTRNQAGQVERAELDRNYETCITGRYPMLCNHQLLTREQTESVAAAERR
jgi:hypothetical protein